MNFTQPESKIYEKMLTLPQCDLHELKQLAINEKNAVWKSLLKIQIAHKITDHGQAINELKTAKAQIHQFLRDTGTPSNERIYRKVMISILSNMISRYFASKKYKECLETLKQLTQQILQINQVKQALYNLFQLTSLTALSNYKLESNAQFKYPPDTQASFFYIVGKVKIAAKKTQQARIAFQKILLLKNSVEMSQHFLLRVYDYLSDIKASNSYTKEYEKIKKSSPQNLYVTSEEKQCFQKIIKSLMDIELRLSIKPIQLQAQPKITKKMLVLYLGKLIHENKNSQNYKFLDKLLSTLSKQTNPTVIKQMLEQTKAAKEAQQFFQTQFDKLKFICLKYSFRKLQGEKNSKLNSNNSNVFYTPIKSILGSKKPQSAPLNVVAQNRKVPKDVNRAKQILKKCSYGSFLMKINFGNNSVVKRFVRIQQKELAWSDDKMDIDSGSKVKWKHVLGIVYGKVSQNLNKNKFWELEPWRCFSLITTDRSYDFYCEEEQDVFLWLQGISYKLQTFHKNQNTYPFYSKGRALWKMTFLKMGKRYKSSSRKFHLQNAGSVISFKRHDSSTHK